MTKNKLHTKANPPENYSYYINQNPTYHDKYRDEVEWNDLMWLGNFYIQNKHSMFIPTNSKAAFTLLLSHQQGRAETFGGTGAQN